MYECSAVQQPVSKQEKVHCKLLNHSESTFVVENDINNGGCRHPSSTVRRKQNIKQQNEIFI